MRCARRDGEYRADGGDQLALAISCVGRRLVLGERTEDEIDAIREALPGGSHLLGFYSYGEIAPRSRVSRSCTTRR